MTNHQPDSVPAFVGSLFGWRKSSSGRLVPNIADSANEPSINISTDVFGFLGVPKTQGSLSDPGTGLERAVQQWLAHRLPAVASHRPWDVQGKRIISDFAQYEHLQRLKEIIAADTSNVLRVAIGEDYLVRPDVTVGLTLPHGRLLHASVSCKWTIRSDRVQNIRHEALNLTRNRRGRQPHIVVVTAEPLPTRLAAIAQGTGEVDGVYHVCLDALVAAATTHGTNDQKSALDALMKQSRLFDLSELPRVLAE